MNDLIDTLKEIMKTLEQKQCELDEIADLTHQLMQKSDNVIAANIEQWEAYQDQIKTFQDEMMILIRKIFQLNEIFCILSGKNKF